jgi:sirohydrochlorin ferrochelatase
MAKSSSGLVESARKMLTSLENHSDTLVSRGVTPEFIDTGKRILKQLEAVRSEEEKIKATLKAQQDTAKAALKTQKAARKITSAQLRTWKSESSRAVKRAYSAQQEKWVDFGIKVKFAKAKKKRKKK